MRLRRLLSCVALVTAACRHEQPFAPGRPTRLTYNPGGDYRAASTADRSSFLYSLQHLFGAEVTS